MKWNLFTIVPGSILMLFIAMKIKFSKFGISQIKMNGIKLEKLHQKNIQKLLNNSGKLMTPVQEHQEMNSGKASIKGLELPMKDLLSIKN